MELFQIRQVNLNVLDLFAVDTLVTILLYGLYHENTAEDTGAKSMDTIELLFKLDKIRCD